MEFIVEQWFAVPAAYQMGLLMVWQWFAVLAAYQMGLLVWLWFAVLVSLPDDFIVGQWFAVLAAYQMGLWFGNGLLYFQPIRLAHCWTLVCWTCSLPDGV